MDDESVRNERLRVQGVLDNLVRVTDELILADVSLGTVKEFLDESVEEMDPQDVKRVLIFAVLDIIKERRYSD